MKKSGVKKIYLDYAATTPIDRRVFAAMRPYFEAKFGNPGSLHSFGQEAMAAVDKAREGIAKAIGADFREIIFTGSATEANNLALRGVLNRFNNSDLRTRNSFVPRIIVSSIEHDSVLETARELEKEGVEVVYLPVLKNGIVDLKKFKEALNERTVLVSVMQANNETGVVQPIREISELISEFRLKNFELGQNLSFPLFHTDAVQAFQFLDCGVNGLGVDLMTLSAHKIYGPKGVGALYINSKSKFLIYKQIQISKNSNKRLIEPMIFGGGQEFGMRSGTENVPVIVGFHKAVELIEVNKEKEAQRIRGLKKKLWDGILKIYPDAKINGVEAEKKVLPNILNVYFPNYLAEEIMVGLDLGGVAVSSGSACSSRSAKASHVLRAMGCGEGRLKRSVRFSLGRPTSWDEIKKVLGILGGILRRLD